MLKLDEASARDRAEALKRDIAGNERLRELAERPLLLTLMAQLQTQNAGSLPQRREELYRKTVELLLDTWEGMKVQVGPDGSKQVEPSLSQWLKADREDIRRQLNRLAFEAHRDQPQRTGTADIPQSLLIDALLRASNRTDIDVGQLARYLSDRAGLLAPHGERMLQFPHRSFQEYLAACHLTDDDFPDRIATLARSDANRWREVALLAGAKAALGASINVWALAETLCPAAVQLDADEPDHWGALLAGLVLLESADLRQVAPRDAPKLARIRDAQLAVLRGARLPAVERALAGRTLAALGDPRPEVMTLDGMQFCLVPPGPFTMGSDDGNDDEKPEHTLNLPAAYLIGRYPVTVAQWREHLAASGQDAAASRSATGRDNDPVTRVSWHDAVAFCTALNRRWQGRLPPGVVVALPSEPEWEKAARGGARVPAAPVRLGLDDLRSALGSAGASKANPSPRREYPWGEDFDFDKANALMGIGQTSAVGGFVGGASPYGCEEMAGNVWEWTRSLWGKDLFKPEFGYPYRLDDRKREDTRVRDDVMRVVRGGSWSALRGGARCGYRDWGEPGSRDHLLGFRLVLRSAAVTLASGHSGL